MPDTREGIVRFFGFISERGNINHSQYARRVKAPKQLAVEKLTGEREILKEYQEFVSFEEE